MHKKNKYHLICVCAATFSDLSMVKNPNHLICNQDSWLSGPCDQFQDGLWERHHSNDGCSSQAADKSQPNTCMSTTSAGLLGRCQGSHTGASQLEADDDWCH